MENTLSSLLILYYITLSSIVIDQTTFQNDLTFIIRQFSKCYLKFLLADEPTGALDSKSGAQVMELFQKLNDEGVTVLMITHDPDIAAHAKRVVMIRDGELKEKEVK